MAPSRGYPTIRAIPSLPFVCVRCQARLFGTTSPFFSGHNRWSKIKHDKGKADAAKNRQRSVFAQEIATASKLFGAELSNNPRLADLVTKAKREGFAKASIEAAIARGQGRSSTGQSLESVTVEGMLPGNVAAIVECGTDSRLRTLADVRLAFKEAGGSSTPTAYLFEKRGRIVFSGKPDVGAEDVLDAALEAGATDVEEDEDGSIVVFSEPGGTTAVGETISSTLDLEIKTSEIIWRPNEDTTVGLASEQAVEELSGFVDDLQHKEPSVQAVAMNIAQGSASGEAWKDLRSRLSM